MMNLIEMQVILVYCTLEMYMGMIKMLCLTFCGKLREEWRFMTLLFWAVQRIVYFLLKLNLEVNLFAMMLEDVVDRMNY